MKLLSVFALILLFNVTHSDGQSEEMFSGKTNTIMLPDGSMGTYQFPLYPGGYSGFMKDLTKTLKYPSTAYQSKMEGTVLVEITIDTLGKIANKVVVKSIRDDLDEAALKAFDNLKSCSPAKQMNKPVEMKIKIPITFQYRKKKPHE